MRKSLQREMKKDRYLFHHKSGNLSFHSLCRPHKEDPGSFLLLYEHWTAKDKAGRKLVHSRDENCTEYSHPFATLV
jgi:hypothetical protein